MSAPIRKPSLRGRGSVAVECAIVLPILLLLISGLLFFARVFWCYTVAQKAAHDGASTPEKAYACLGCEVQCGCCLDYAQEVIDEGRGKRAHLRLVA